MIILYGQEMKSGAVGKAGSDREKNRKWRACQTVQDKVWEEQ